MDAEITKIPTWPTSMHPGGIAIAPDGSMWVVQRPDLGTSSHLQEFDKDGKLQRTYTLPPLPEDKLKRAHHSTPSYVALQLKSDQSVEAIWVSDHGGEVVYRISPMQTDSKDVKIIDCGQGSGPQGIAWDATRAIVWVADTTHNRLIAFDTSTLQEKTDLSAKMPDLSTQNPHWASLTVHPVMVAPDAKGNVWYTAQGDGVGLVAAYQPDKKQTVWASLGTKTDTAPYGLAIDEAAGTVWVVAQQDAGLWKVNDIKNISALGPNQPLLVQRINSFPTPTAYEMTIDSLGYLWVADEGNVYQLSPDGMLTHTYKTDAKGVRGLAYSRVKDVIVISDTNNSSLLQLTPVDQLPDPGKSIAEIEKLWKITSTPAEGSVVAGDPFTFTIHAEYDGKPRATNVTLVVPPYRGLFFKNPTDNETTEKTGSDGNKLVNLSTATNAPPAQFDVVARIRGLKTLSPIFHGIVGIAADAIDIIDDAEEYTFVERLFPTQLKLKVNPPQAYVRLEANSKNGAHFSTFSDGNTGALVHGDDTGMITIALQGGTKAEKLSVVATSAVFKKGTSPVSVTFKDRIVTEIPQTLKVSDTKLTITAGGESTNSSFTATVQDKSGDPVPGAWVELALIPPQNKEWPKFYETKTGQYNPEKGDSPQGKDGRIIIAQTDKNGNVGFGPDTQYLGPRYYVYSPEEILNMAMLVQISDSILRNHPDALTTQSIDIVH